MAQDDDSSRVAQRCQKVGHPWKITIGRKYRLKTSWPWIKQWFLRYDNKNTCNKRKTKINWNSSNLKLLSFKGYHQESEKISHKIGEWLLICTKFLLGVINCSETRWWWWMYCTTCDYTKSHWIKTYFTRNCWNKFYFII